MSEHYTVGMGWDVRAKLASVQVIPGEIEGKPHRLDQKMLFCTKVYPEPWNAAYAHEAAMGRLQPFLDLGWRIESLVITQAGLADA